MLFPLKFKKYVSSIYVFLILFCYLNLNAQTKCELIKSYEINSEFSEISQKELYLQISKLNECGYDSIEIKILKTKSFLGELVLNAITNKLQSNEINKLTLNNLLSEFDKYKNDPEFESKKYYFLKHIEEFERSENELKNLNFDDLYPNKASKFNKDSIKTFKLNKNILILFSNKNGANCEKFKNLVLNKESISSLINSNFYFIELETNPVKNKSNDIEKANSKIQIELFETNYQPFLGVLNSKGEVIGRINYALDSNKIEFELIHFIKTEN